jgi:hypothetical protein
MFSTQLDLTEQQQFALMEHLTERKHSFCISCDTQIASPDEAASHRNRAHDVLDYHAAKGQLSVN